MADHYDRESFLQDGETIERVEEFSDDEPRTVRRKCFLFCCRPSADVFSLEFPVTKIFLTTLLFYAIATVLSSYFWYDYRSRIDMHKFGSKEWIAALSEKVTYLWPMNTAAVFSVILSLLQYFANGTNDSCNCSEWNDMSISEDSDVTFWSGVNILVQILGLAFFWMYSVYLNDHRPGQPGETSFGKVAMIPGVLGIGLVAMIWRMWSKHERTTRASSM